MKKRFRLFSRLMAIAILLSMVNCAQDEYGNGLDNSAYQKKTSFKMLQGDEAASIKGKMQKLLSAEGMVQRNETFYGTIKYDDIMRVIDSLGNTNYTFRVVHPEDSDKKFFNLVLNEKDGFSTVALIKYNMDDDFSLLYQINGDIKDFKGYITYTVINTNRPCNPDIPGTPVEVGGSHPPAPPVMPGDGGPNLFDLIMPIFIIRAHDGNADAVPEESPEIIDPRTFKITTNGAETPGIVGEPCEGDNEIGILDPRQNLNNFIAGLYESQLQWWYDVNNEDKKNAVVNYLVENSYSDESVEYVKYMIDQDINNPDYSIDFPATLKSPCLIDLSHVSGTSPEEIRFNSVYNKLLQSPKFKELFTHVFGVTNFINVRFEIADLPPVNGNQNPGKCQLYAPSNGQITNVIIIDRSALSERADDYLSVVIIHEVLHAFLNVKLRHPSIGMSIEDINNNDFAECINTSYGSFSEPQSQHSFIADFMAPYIAEILIEIKDLIIKPEDAFEVEFPSNGGAFLYEPLSTVPPSISDVVIPWDWNDYFHYISYGGLQFCSSFQSIFPPNSIIEYFRQHYTQIGYLMFNP